MKILNQEYVYRSCLDEMLVAYFGRLETVQAHTQNTFEKVTIGLGGLKNNQ